ncbi:MAG TPA: Fe-S cluster assembly ATPase SufC [Acidimicrobiales bacterium]|nr:Fe-S cluster assembly ATPase SufC [Acidimicrobiales bacterium]
MSVLRIEGLRAAVGGREILRGVDLEVRSGETHAVMGPNGSGKSTLAHVLMGRPGYDVLGGSVTIDGEELLGRPVDERARRGLFLAFQYPIEVPGVPVVDALREALEAAGRSTADLDGQMSLEAERVGLPPGLLSRPMNVDLSGGEKKRNETLQLAILRPRFAVLDELDSGLDVDALRQVARRVEAALGESEPPLGVVAITHYRRLLEELQPDVVHVLSEGRIVRSGGPELAAELEATGYAGYRAQPDGRDTETAGGDPFADPLGR